MPVLHNEAHALGALRRPRRRARASLAEWAEHCPENFEHKLLLVRAEEARVEKRELEAISLYAQAVEGAEQGEMTRDEALAYGRCARFHLASGRTRIARSYMSAAYAAYVPESSRGLSATASQLATKV